MAEESAADRLKAARERAGLSPEEMAERIGITVAWYHDLEFHPDEIFDTVSLTQIETLAAAVGLNLTTLILGNDTATASPVSFEQLVERLRAVMSAEGLDVEEFGNRVGWELEDVLSDPQELWDFNVDGLQDLCGAAGVDWRAVLAGLGKRA